MRGSRFTKFTMIAALAGLSVGVSAVPSSAAPGTKPVALIIAQGGLGDQSYNDSAYAGFKTALTANSLTGSPVESADVVAQATQILESASSGSYGLAIDLEYTHADPMTTVAAAHPSMLYAEINNEAKGANVLNVLFQEQEASYLAGALAAMMTSVKGNKKINSKHIIGAIGGCKCSGIDKFIAGYMQGARAVDPKIKVLIAYSNSFGDPAKGKQLATAMFARGADIVYSVAGGVGAGVIAAAKASNHYAIGVDTNQDGLAPGYVLTSMVKHVDVLVQRIVKDYAKGTFTAGRTISVGLRDGAVGLTSFQYTKKVIPATFLAKIAKMRQDIIDGNINPWNIYTQGYPKWYKSS
jgi:basic membrane protein A